MQKTASQIGNEVLEKLSVSLNKIIAARGAARRAADGHITESWESINDRAPIAADITKRLSYNKSIPERLKSDPQASSWMRLPQLR